MNVVNNQSEIIVVGLANKAWLSQYRDAKCTPDMIRETFMLMREARSQGNIELEQSYYLNHSRQMVVRMRALRPRPVHSPVGSEPIQVQVGRPGINAPRSGKLQPGDSISYDDFKNVDGYVWVHYKGYSSDDLFLPTHPSRTPNNLWGSFSE